ncbi:MAG: hypothetical protein QOI44_2041 [Actinomycetota bacterium]|jgi:hypothetical protein|nr:hypothetical protein [Actinomycetota bacterium]
MRRASLSVIEPLQLLSVRRFGSRLWLAVCDQARRRHFISFRFNTAAQARDQLRHMSGWVAHRTPLAYVRRRGESALVDIDALLARAIA